MHSRVSIRDIYSKPVFDKWVWGGGGVSRWLLNHLLILLFSRGLGKRFFRHKYNFEFAAMQIIADHHLVSVTFQGLSCFGEEEVWIGFQLVIIIPKTGIGELEQKKTKTCRDGKCLLTLKETMKPPFVHSSTIGFKIFGTWSISIDKFPLPDCILCSDYTYRSLHIQ